jgi:hypothetical protein
LFRPPGTRTDGWKCLAVHGYALEPPGDTAVECGRARVN